MINITETHNDPLMAIAQEVKSIVNSKPNPTLTSEELMLFGAFLTDNLERLAIQRELLIYWLLKSYRAMSRSGWEEGQTIEECRDDLLSVLANLGLDPNECAAAKAVVDRERAYYTSQARRRWMTPEPTKV